MNLFWMVDLECRASNGVPFLLETLLSKVMRDDEDYYFDAVVLRMARAGEIPPVCAKNRHRIKYPDEPVFLFLFREDAIEWREKLLRMESSEESYDVFSKIDANTRQILADTMDGKYMAKNPEDIAIEKKTLTSLLLNKTGGEDEQNETQREAS